MVSERGTVHFSGAAAATISIPTDLDRDDAAIGAAVLVLRGEHAQMLPVLHEGRQFVRQFFNSVTPTLRVVAMPLETAAPFCAFDASAARRSLRDVVSEPQLRRWRSPAPRRCR